MTTKSFKHIYPAITFQEYMQHNNEVNEDQRRMKEIEMFRERVTVSFQNFFKESRGKDAQN